MKKIKLLLYCTKSKECLWSNDLKYFFLDGAYNRLLDDLPKYLLNDKIVAECDFDVEEIAIHKTDIGVGFDIIYYTEKMEVDKIIQYSFLGIQEMENYLGTKKDNGEIMGYAIHIKNLHIFDRPRELNQYHRPYGCINISCERKTKGKYLGCSLVRHCKITQIKKAPQNMMKVESKICDEKDYVLISIRSEWLCKILNGEKTIEIRKKVLKEMINNA